MTGGSSWFLAFPVDGALLSRLAAPPEGLRCLHADDLHLTIAFLGACGEERAGQALAMLDRFLAQSPIAPLTVSLGEVVPMGNPRAYSALSVLLVEGREALAATLGELRDPLADAASAPRETRVPKPHVTLARPARRATDAQRAGGLAWARTLALGDVRLRLDRIALYTGAHERAERRYRVVAERALT